MLSHGYKVQKIDNPSRNFHLLMLLKRSDWRLTCFIFDTRMLNVAPVWFCVVPASVSSTNGQLSCCSYACCALALLGMLLSRVCELHAECEQNFAPVRYTNVNINYTYSSSLVLQCCHVKREDTSQQVRSLFSVGVISKMIISLYSYIQKRNFVLNCVI